jgi:hypothetical protein
MPSTEAQRTLVKSPPELWAELSDPASLARHLGEFGEIRIARVEAEKSVAWEADAVTGTVELKPSGWGTRVTLTVVRELPEPVAVESEPEAVAVKSEPEAAPEPEQSPEPETSPEPGAVAVESEPEPVAVKSEPEQSPEPETSPEPEAAAETAPEEDLDPQLTTRRSRFLAWLLRRRNGRTAEPEQPPAVEAEPAQPEQPPAAEAEPAQPEQPPAEMPPLDLAAELAAELALVEEAMVEQDTALLSAVLDRLGAAHHRPFSRG